MPTYPKPTTGLPEWALADQVNPTSSQNNVIAPGATHKNFGWDFKEKPPRQFFNWLGRLTHEWLAFLQEEQQTSTAISTISPFTLLDETDTPVTTLLNTNGWIKRINGETGVTPATALMYFHFKFKTASALKYVYITLPSTFTPTLQEGSADLLQTQGVAYSKEVASAHTPAAGFYSIPVDRGGTLPMLAFGDTQALGGLPAATSFPILNGANDGYYIDGFAMFQCNPSRL